MAIIADFSVAMPPDAAEGMEQLVSRLQRTLSGDWKAVPYRSDRFMATGGSWAVAANQVTLRMMRIGPSLWLDFSIELTSVTGISELRMALPDGLTSIAKKSALVFGMDNGVAVLGIARVNPNETIIRFYSAGGALWAVAAGTTSLYGQLVVEVRP
jgi:hypothetical protein